MIGRLRYYEQYKTSVILNTSFHFQLYLSNIEWDEDVTNNNIWRPIEEIIKID